MITTKQLKIFSIFSKNVFKEHSYRELKELSGVKSNSVLQNAIKKFLKEELISERKIGTSKLYKINYDNDKVYTYFDISIKENLNKLVKKSISIIKQELDKYSFFYSLVIFGSYANSTFREKSDLDIAIFIPDKNQEKNFKVAVNSAENKSLIGLDVHIITAEDFLEMLSVDYENLGKEIIRNNLPVYNSAVFYKLAIKGVKHESKIIS
ncbi:MAG: nucleotidyltransferase domain-containing protein [Nanoarchaeota archaeon]|nr:nucleotidyltransferase domain-containing protein [Nanoarchaeota archaeon]MBU1321688.1 nucleotidyltransferase domain-containing protein [Nanoarchaeota archaeon]MBU1598071.1 nucleotidyltransferase domain-containing protein [Nanoarchaeota archaeon]MBU2441637.1 nucleotidyltransferase domain-containing protein [Nanoarchaeota archaeon]